MVTQRHEEVVLPSRRPKNQHIRITVRFESIGPVTQLRIDETMYLKSAVKFKCITRAIYVR